MSKLEMDINDVFAKYKLCKKDPANGLKKKRNQMIDKKKKFFN